MDGKPSTSSEWGRNDLIITDVMMPNMDGMELLDRLHEIRADSSIILVTGHRSRCRRGGQEAGSCRQRNLSPSRIFSTRTKTAMRERHLLSRGGRTVRSHRIPNRRRRRRNCPYTATIYESFENIAGDNQAGL